MVKKQKFNGSKFLVNLSVWIFRYNYFVAIFDFTIKSRQVLYLNVFKGHLIFLNYTALETAIFFYPQTNLIVFPDIIKQLLLIKDFTF